MCPEDGQTRCTGKLFALFELFEKGAVGKSITATRAGMTITAESSMASLQPLVAKFLFSNSITALADMKASDPHVVVASR
jgi:hypothetical protein